ncbi:MAG: hypothetical protein ACE5JG_09610, partial [Planctomycetota bacterium]
MRARAMTVAPALLLAAAVASAGEKQTEVHDCATTAGWAAKGGSGPGPKTPALTCDGQAVVWRFERGPAAKLIHAALLTELEEISLDVRSEQAAVLGLVVPDRDGRAFFRLFRLPAGKPTTIRAGPKDFTPVAAVKDRGALDPRRLGIGYVLVDRSPQGGRNTIAVDEVRITRRGFEKTRGAWTVQGDTAVSQSLLVGGALRVPAGTRLSVTAPQFGLGGDLAIEDAAVEISGGAFVVPQRFPHERTLTLSGSSRLRWRDAVVATARPLSVKLEGRSRLEAQDCWFSGGLTCAVRPGTSVRLTNVTSPGELVIMPGADVSVSRSRAVLLWLAAGPNLKGTFTLPAGEQVAAWSADHGWKVSVRDCTNIMWGLVSTAGCEATLSDCAFRAVGLHFGGSSNTTLSDVHNGRPLPDGKLAASDRSLRFARSRVQTWNVYTTLGATLTVERST